MVYATKQVVDPVLVFFVPRVNEWVIFREFGKFFRNFSKKYFDRFRFLFGRESHVHFFSRCAAERVD